MRVFFFLLDHKVSNSIHIDGTDTGHEGCWVWTSQTVTPIPPDFTPWSAGQPDNSRSVEHCNVLRYSHRFDWNDIPCDHTDIYLCERDLSQSDTETSLPAWNEVIHPNACQN